MRILMICSSPNAEGNTSRIMNEVARQLREKGAEIRWHDLTKMKVAGCQGCRRCQAEGSCAIHDDMQQVVADLQWADAFMLGSPVYMGSETGQTKCLIDRLYCLHQAKPDGTGKGRLPPGKMAITLLTCGLPDGDKMYAYENTKFYQVFAKLLGFDFVMSSIVPSCGDPMQVMQNYHAQHAISDTVSFLYP
jgi:multimeric flavodoxin WrbA